MFKYTNIPFIILSLDDADGKMLKSDAGDPGSIPDEAIFFEYIAAAARA